jgi:serine/threonine-protein kinase
MDIPLYFSPFISYPSVIHWKTFIPIKHCRKKTMSMSADMNNPAPSTRLSGKPLVLARLAWWGIAILTFIYMIATQIYRLGDKPLDILYEQEVNLLNQIGVSPNFYVIYFNIIAFIAVLFFLIVGYVIFWRRSDDWMAILVSLTLMTGSLISFRWGYRMSVAQPDWRFLYILFFMISGIGVEIIFFTFPDGRFIPAWSRWVIVPFALFALLRPVVMFIDDNLDASILFYIWNSLYGASLLAQIFRYRKVSNPIQRQQAKWVIYGLTLMILVSSIPDDLLLTPMLFPLLGGLSTKIYFFVYIPLIIVGSFLAPVLGIGFSILRYRLWDIDFIINRSLVYGALTAVLAALFGGSLFIVSQLFQNFSGGPLVAVAISATVFGAVFQPTRRHVQRFVDQRFYHIEIDYQKTPPNLATDGMTQVLRQTNFGEYKNLELIGRGGMAEVYKSTNPTTGKPVAIKILPKALASETEFRQRFTRESQVVSQLEHPNIIRIFDSGEQDGQYYMVMEYLVGKDLSQMIQANGKLPLAQTLPLVQQIASALDYAHANGFVHRDIKPGNVLLDSNGTRAVLTDFGIAKVNNAHTVMTVTGYMLGTFDYIAPEQIQESSHVDGKADIYALGVMVYQMLTGQLPFKHNNPGALLIAHLNQPAPDACEILSDLPKNIGVAIQRAMAKKPEERFTIAAEFASAIGG